MRLSSFDLRNPCAEADGKRKQLHPNNTRFERRPARCYRYVLSPPVFRGDVGGVVARGCAPAGPGVDGGRLHTVVPRRRPPRSAARRRQDPEVDQATAWQKVGGILPSLGATSFLAILPIGAIMCRGRSQSRVARSAIRRTRAQRALLMSYTGGFGSGSDPGLPKAPSREADGLADRSLIPFRFFRQDESIQDETASCSFVASLRLETGRAAPDLGGSPGHGRAG